MVWRARGGALRIVHPQALAHLFLQTISHAGHAVTSQHRQRTFVNGLLIVETGEENLQQIFADAVHSSLEGRFNPSVLF